MSHVLDLLTTDEHRAVRESDQPRWTEPMLATLTRERFADPQWIFERKLDGVRLLVFRRDGEVRLLTRNREERSSPYPILRDELEAAPGGNWVADGEVVAFDGRVTSFSRLQRRMHVEEEDEARERAREVAVYLYLFDLLHVDGHDLTPLNLRGRKKLLKRVLTFRGHVRFTSHRNGDGPAFWREACRRGWEGVIAKDARAPYTHGRSRSWLKFKCTQRQEMVVGGFTEPEGERVGFGARLLGYFEGSALVYAGKVGTGWDDETLRELRARMERIRARRRRSIAATYRPTASDGSPRTWSWRSASPSGRKVGSSDIPAISDVERTKIPRTWCGSTRTNAAP